MTTTDGADATEAENGQGKAGSPPVVKSSDTLRQDIKDSWDERHAKRADVAYRIGEAIATMRTARWEPRSTITKETRRDADRYLSAQYRLAEALTERNARGVAAMNVSSAATGLIGGAWATVLSGLGRSIAAVISAPRMVRMWRLRRFSIRHPELRELDATVNSRPDTRLEVIDGRAATHVKAAGHPDPVDFSKKMSWLFRLDEPPRPELSSRDIANRVSAESIVGNAIHAAREAYLNDSKELYLSPQAMRDWEGAGHNSTTADPSLGGKG